MEIRIGYTVILLVFGILSAVAGYLERVSKKVEERRDETYLETLPEIYSNLITLRDAINQFCGEGPLTEFSTVLEGIKKGLHDVIFSSNILVFREDLHDALYSLSIKVNTLEALAKQVEESGTEDERDLFRKSKKVKEPGSEDDMALFRNNKPEEPFKFRSLQTNLNTILNETENLISSIKKELSGYRSVSFKLILLVILLGIIFTAVEIINTVVNLEDIF